MRVTCSLFLLVQLLMTFGLTKAIHVDVRYATFYADTNFKYLVMAYGNTCYLWHLHGTDADHLGFSVGQTAMERRLVQAVEQGLISVTPATLPDPTQISVVIHTTCKQYPSYWVYAR